MDRFFDRLGDILKNFLDDDQGSPHTSGRQASSYTDPDLRTAYEELDEFLNPRRAHVREETQAEEQARNRRRSYAGSPAPDRLRPDFAELGVAFGASEEECKTAYKKLLNIHHPDRHAGHRENMKKATEKASRINAAYQRIEDWRRSGRAD